MDRTVVLFLRAMHPASASQTAKGASTRERLVEHATGLAGRYGLEGVTIGDLAASAGMSKSGVFAHFGSREDLLRETLDSVATEFVGRIMTPALAQPRGLQRLRAIAEHWIRWIEAHPDGCIFLSAMLEYDGRPGPMRDHVAALSGGWRQAIERAVQMAVDSGELAARVDVELLAFQLQAVVEGLHHARLHQPQSASRLARAAVDELLGRHLAAPASPNH